MTKALVIIDVQKGMWEHPDYPPYDGDGVLQRIADLIAKARAAKAPVMYVQHHGAGNHPFQPGKPGFPFHDAKLKRAGIDHLVVTGMQSEYCVDSAIRGAHERGYKVTLVSDAHSTGNTKVAKAGTIIAIQK